MYRTPDKRSQTVRIAAYAIAGTLAAAGTGAVLGLLGGLVPGSLRAVLAALVSLVAVGLGLLELTGRRIPVVQVDRETPYEWLGPGSLPWAVRNGAALGFGARTRLGFWLWYVIPIAAFLSGEPIVGAVGYGAYGLVRTLSVGGLLKLERAGRFTDIEVLRSSGSARMITNVQLVAVGLLALILVGL